LTGRLNRSWVVADATLPAYAVKARMKRNHPGLIGEPAVQGRPAATRAVRICPGSNADVPVEYAVIAGPAQWNVGRWRVLQQPVACPHLVRPEALQGGS